MPEGVKKSEVLEYSVTKLLIFQNIWEMINRLWRTEKICKNS